MLAAVVRAGAPFTGAKLPLAMKCWKENTCDTGTGGKSPSPWPTGSARTCGVRSRTWSSCSGALTYPEIGKIIYTSGQRTRRSRSRISASLIAQKVERDRRLPGCRGSDAAERSSRRRQRGIVYVPYTSTRRRKPGKDYLTFVAEDLCQLGKNFAA